MNRAAATITGYSPEDLSTRDAWFTRLYGFRAASVRADYDAARDAGFPAPLRSTATRKDGAIRFLELVGHRLADHEVWLLHDVTERIALEERMHAIVTTATDAFITIDPQGTVESVNPAVAQMFGYAASEVVGQNVRMLMPEPYRSQHDAYLARYRDTREARIIGTSRDLAAQHKDGRTFPIELSVSELDQGFTLVIRDLTNRKTLERSQAVARTEERVRLSRDLHDELGGELTGIALLVASLLKKLEEDGSPYAERAGAIAARMDVAHQRVREIAHGLLPVDTGPDGLANALIAMANDCTATHGTCHCRVFSHPPIRLDDPTIASHLFHIAREATTNALRHAAPSIITISVAKDEHHVRLEIVDNGTGFPKEPSKGGRGLATMHERARELGGQLSVQPRPEGGTTVTCEIPLPPVTTASA